MALALIQFLMLRKLFFTLILLSSIPLIFHLYIKYNHSLSLIRLSFKQRKFGLLNQVNILGNNLLSENTVFKIIGVSMHQPLYSISAHKIRNKLLKLDEVKDVNVVISYTGTLSITIIERQPFAIWWNKNPAWLIDNEGNRISEISNLDNYQDLIIIFGQHFQDKLKQLLNLVHPFFLYKKIRSLHYIGNRRWDIYIDNTTVIKLPENKVESAIEKSEKILKNYKYSNKIDIVDLRLYPKKIFLRLKHRV